MFRITPRGLLRRFWMVALILCVLSFPIGPVGHTVGRDLFAAAERGNYSSLAGPSGNTNAYLPFVTRDYISPLQTVFGVEISSASSTSGFREMVAAGTSWMRISWGGVLWSVVESTEGVRDWSKLDSLEATIKNVAENHIRLILVVRSTPEWAQKNPGYSCGPIREDKLDAFASFMHDLVLRYSQPPYNVKVWEIYNEPDIAPELVAPDSVWGCWGDTSDTYYGGGYYAQILKAVTPQIKAADPQAQVLVGGLLLDCNPDDPPAGKTCLSSKFLEGILRNGGGFYLDGVAFHAYDFYQGTLGAYHNPGWKSDWNTTGPSSIAKANFIQDLLAAYGFADKFVMNTENALLCGSCDDNSTFETTKAYFLAQSYAAALADGLWANVWHKIFDWRNSGLLNPDLSPRPAYNAYRFARVILQNATPVEALSYDTDGDDIDEVRGYTFSREDCWVWILWGLNQDTHLVDLPATPAAVYDVFGAPLTPTARLEISLKPLYIELPKNGTAERGEDSPSPASGNGE